MHDSTPLMQPIPTCTDTLRRTLDAIEPGAGARSLHELAALFVRHSCPRGRSLLAQGQPWQDALLIETGLVRMHFVRRDGREFNKNFFAESTLVCPLTPAMWSEPSLFAISALEASALWRCDAAAFREVLQAHGEWQPLRGELLSRLLTAKLQREHELLAHDGRTRYERFCAAQPGLARRVPLRHLASYLGLTDVSLSRLRRQQRHGA